MNAPERLPLPDIQSSFDGRAIAIDRVGIRGLRHPVRVALKGGRAIETVAHVDMAVALPAHVKGTHMSRFLEVLQRNVDPLHVTSLPVLLAAMLNRLEAREGWIELRFPVFLEKAAPVSRVPSLMDYDVRLSARRKGTEVQAGLEVSVPVTSLCPCSKEISEYGAHNQRSRITLSVDLAAPMEAEDLIEVAEHAASCELYGLLKRVDEKHVTERAYENPKFVEDLVRDIAVRLNDDRRIAAYRIESENFESIHNHSAYAVIERGELYSPPDEPRSGSRTGATRAVG